MSSKAIQLRRLKLPLAGAPKLIDLLYSCLQFKLRQHISPEQSTANQFIKIIIKNICYALLTISDK